MPQLKTTKQNSQGRAKRNTNTHGLKYQQLEDRNLLAGDFFDASIYYRGSSFDDGGLGAISDKTRLSAGDVATFDNYSSYDKGINGLVLDVDFDVTPSLATIDDFFEFKVGNSNFVSTWTDPAEAPFELLFQSDVDGNGTDRVILNWNDGVISNTWLETKILANAMTGLAAEEVFYFGNAIGETGNNSANAIVNLQDVGLTRSNQTGFSGATIDNVFDVNRDSRVNLIDVGLVRFNQSGFGALELITPATQGWGQVGSNLEGEALGDVFGFSSSINEDGSRIAVGGRANDGGAENAGHVRVFEFDGTSWNQLGADIDGATENETLGESVSLSADGSVVAIGASGVLQGLTGDSVTRIFAWDGTNWVQRGADIEGVAAGDVSGSSISISSDGTAIAIGAYGNGDGVGGSYSGHVRIFDWTGTAWVQRGLDLDGEASNDFSGISSDLSADGNVVAIGATGNDGGATTSGHVRVYEWNGTAWNQRGIDIDGAAFGERLGDSVSLSNDGAVLAAGGTGANAFAGVVRVFDWTGTAWIQRGLDIIGDAGSNLAGNSVSLSSSGDVVVLGASGANESSGLVRVLRWDGTSWEIEGRVVEGEAQAESFGQSVSVSGDGSTFVAGAISHDSSRGKARVFQWDGAPLGRSDSDGDDKSQKRKGDASGDSNSSDVAQLVSSIDTQGFKLGVSASKSAEFGRSQRQVNSILRLAGSVETDAAESNRVSEEVSAVSEKVNQSTLETENQFDAMFKFYV